MKFLTNQRACWLAILCVALALRLVAGAWWQARLPAGKTFYFGDSDSYWVLGRAIARGEPYQYGSADRQVLRTPGYPLLLAPLFVVWDGDPPVLAARALSALLGAAAVAVVGWWTTQLFDARAGLIAGWLAALYPGAISMGAFVLSEAPFCPLMLLQMGLWGLAWRSDARARCLALAAGAGLCGGAASLMRPSWLLFLPFALLVSLLLDRMRARQLLVGATMIAALVLVMLPWWVRNARVTGHFVPTALVVGASLYDGLSPAADGSSNMDFMPGFAALERAEPSGAPDDNFEYRLDRRLRQAALDWAAAHPAQVAELALVKFWRIWNVWPNEPGLRSWPLRTIVVLTYGPLLAVSLVGAWRFSSSGWPYILAWLPAVYLTLLHVVFVGSIRYREPAMLALLPLAAGVLARASPALVTSQEQAA